MTTTDLETFRQLVESHSPRSLRRYLDYAKRLRSGSGLDELAQWLSRILLDDGSVYGLGDRALAFEVAACERLRDMWTRMTEVEPEVVTIGGAVDKMAIYRRLLDPGAGDARRGALLEVMKERYGKTWSWLRDAASSDRPAGTDSDHGSQHLLLDPFLEALNRIEPLDVGDASAEQLARMREEVERQEASLKTLAQELETAEDRAARAHQRAKTSESETKQLRRQLREERENGEKLRQERRRRIKVERETRESINELQRLRSEYVKLDERLREMAHRAAAAEARRGAGGSATFRIDLSPLRSLAASQLLGLRGPPGIEELNRARRRFATALHSDRVNQLPVWVGELFDELMGIINETCDRSTSATREGSAGRRPS